MFHSDILLFFFFFVERLSVYERFIRSLFSWYKLVYILHGKRAMCNNLLMVGVESDLIELYISFPYLFAVCWARFIYLERDVLSTHLVAIIVWPQQHIVTHKDKKKIVILCVCSASHCLVCCLWLMWLEHNLVKRKCQLHNELFKYTIRD